LAKASRGASVEKMAALVADEKRAPDARVELLRAFSERLAEVGAPADAAIAALSNGAAFTTRYLLAFPIAAMARAGDAAAAARLASMITSDADAPVRAHAAESATGVEGAREALAHAVDDASPRVRDAALRALTTAKPPVPVSSIAHRLATDEWTFVRASAAAALASFAPDAHVDDALIAALGDRAPTVRAEVIAALAAHGVRRAAPAIRAHLIDPHETLETRITAVHALSAMCDRDSADALTAIARRGAVPLATDEDITLGLEAIHALGALHPPDLASRLAPVAAKDASAEARAAAARALASAPSCR
jgi:HEAT repeat protein